MSNKGIQFFHRYSKSLETEKVYGDFWVNFLYKNPLGYLFTNQVLSRPWLSKIYGQTQSSRSSAAKVPAFIEEFGIDMNQFEAGPFDSFNDFFIRKFKPGVRIFPENPHALGAPAEARYYGYDGGNNRTSIPVKGVELDPILLLGGLAGKERFRNGPCLLARLCPVDYHRFHFPDSGQISQVLREEGKLHSVNPVALEKNPRLFLQNERQISLLETEHFGSLAYVEVGALCVGKIVQSHEHNYFQRGEEKGYFLFGGSTVILYGEKGRWQPSADILENTNKGLETYIHLGDTVATK